jgi:UDP-N-acetylmuramate dehydrogenase
VSREKADDLERRYPALWRRDLPEGGTQLATSWLLDHALGLRGAREGDVGTWPGQAAVVVNYGRASTKDILAFTEMIKRRAKEELGIDLVSEVEYLAS